MPPPLPSRFSPFALGSLFLVMFAALSLGLGGCVPRTQEPAAVVILEDEPVEVLAPNTEEFTGVLQVTEPTCEQPDDCGPRFTLLGRQLKTRIVIEGDIDPAHQHLILTVIGSPQPLPAEMAARSGYEGIRTMVTATHYRQRSEIPYTPFLGDQAGVYSVDNFGCELAWGRVLSWDIADDAPLLKVRLTDEQADAPRPWLLLTYDGNTGELLDAAKGAEQASPCSAIADGADGGTGAADSIGAGAATGEVASADITADGSVITTTDGESLPAPIIVAAGWYVRVGSYIKRANAKSMLARLTEVGYKPNITPVKLGNISATRVWLGPYPERHTALAISSRIIPLSGEPGYVTRDH